MYSISWPNMFNSNRVTTNLVSDKDAIKSNLKLLLNSERMTLFGDPYFGASLNQVLFQPNNTLIVDLIIDELYTTIIEYMPQLYLTRNDISISIEKNDLIAKLYVTYRLDNTSDLYVINLTNNTEEV